MNVKEALSVYFICGTQDVVRPLDEILTEALEAGITMFQLREKGEGSIQDKEERYALARRLKQLCSSYHVPFVVNDDVELALEVEADGLHIGQDDGDASKIKGRLPSSMLFGISAYTVEEAEQAIRDGADYIGVGPMYATRSKADAKSAVGPERIRLMRDQGVDLPIVAIGGITTSHVKEIKKAGADGVSIISAIARASSIEKAVRLFKG
ncbi:thiamine phosphate synthase [Paenalkalicoccus suaedae]|uniref:thiamine phosphate synthase n=1 Tax=Paenalkalicoccus suaedae TaxID=2592382 RepID=UPI00201BCB05|nr:thiamine phosphate synthase [Paenalkalicoccus suaedae]